MLILARVFVLGGLLQPCLMVVGKARSLPMNEHLKVASFRQVLAFLANIRLGWRGLSWTTYLGTIVNYSHKGFIAFCPSKQYLCYWFFYPQVQVLRTLVEREGFALVSQFGWILFDFLTKIGCIKGGDQLYTGIPFCFGEAVGKTQGKLNETL